MRKLYYVLTGIAMILVTIVACEQASVEVEELQAIEKVELSGKVYKCTTIQSGTLTDKLGETITTGYDQWGYNYQAKLFNGYYCDSYRNASWCQDYNDIELSMKWNSAWMSNQDCDGDGELDRHFGFDTFRGSGAWLTNHQKGLYTYWDVQGDWVLEFDYLGKIYIHDMTIENNIFTGYGTSVGQSPEKIWTVGGTITGNIIEMTINYNNSTYYVDIIGTIAPDGTMDGTWGNLTQSGTFESTEGSATLVECEWDYFVKIVAAPLDATLTDGVWYNTEGIEIGPEIWNQFAIIQEVENDFCAGLEGKQYGSPVGPGLGKF